MLHTHDEGYVHTKDKQIKTLADFKGLKMRAPTRQTNKLLAKLGAAPVAMPLPADAGGDVERRDRRLPAAVGGHSKRQAARVDQVPHRDPRKNALCTAPCS